MKYILLILLSSGLVACKDNKVFYQTQSNPVTGQPGNDGKDGKNGSSLISEKGAPDDTTGQDGDSYFDTETADYYIKVSGTWVKETNLTGPQGLQGIQGIAGLQGAQGPQGLPGLNGSVGPMGPQGPMGLQGLKGDTGVQGPEGKQGPKGDTGATGPQGIKGDKGDKGDAGSVAIEIHLVSGICVGIGDGLFAKSEGDKIRIYDDSSCSPPAVISLHEDDTMFYHKKKIYVQDGIRKNVLGVITFN